LFQSRIRPVAFQLIKNPVAFAAATISVDEFPPIVSRQFPFPSQIFPEAFIFPPTSNTSPGVVLLIPILIFDNTLIAIDPLITVSSLAVELL